ncbi:MAG: hypothetical protein JO117_09065 [Verrucomicrobia bacterium]|nr:hypothetical protein [Verrucomicrobiota bacterium]MBV9659415.1 hypothetical protein [Verrucomicrobiota bacterium]
MTQRLPQEEMVLCVRRQLFDELGSFQGLNFEVERYLPAFLARKNNGFLPRAQAENDPSFKQLIPYVLLVHAGRVLHYVRGKKGGESRLHAKGSVGVGGHLNDSDESLFSWDETAYRAGVAREVAEELNLQTSYRDNIRALLNDDSNEVGRVHLGVVHVFTLETDRVARRENALTQIGFLTPDELRARRDSLETWSQLCVDALARLLDCA